MSSGRLQSRSVATRKQEEAHRQLIRRADFGPALVGPKEENHEFESSQGNVKRPYGGKNKAEGGEREGSREVGMKDGMNE